MKNASDLYFRYKKIIFSKFMIYHTFELTNTVNFYIIYKRFELFIVRFADVAQSVAHRLGKAEVTGSSPAISSK